MASNYPASLDNFPTTRTNATASDTTHPSDHNDAFAAINAMQNEVGTIPGWGPTSRTQTAGRGMLMTSTLLENIPRWGATFSAVAAPASGTIRVVPLGVAKAGLMISAISFIGATTGATATAMWAGIARFSDRVVLARSNNGTTLPTVNAVQTFTFATTYTPTNDEVIVGFLNTTATTPPTYYGITVVNAVFTGTPTIAGTSNTGQSTTPLTVGAAMTAFTASTGVLYAQLR